MRGEIEEPMSAAPTKRTMAYEDLARVFEVINGAFGGYPWWQPRLPRW